MGCVHSQRDKNDVCPNVFQVMNVDDMGNLITPGKLKITEMDIILYQRGKQSVKWPLRCLRRYGYDTEIFSFESGRRCSTGPGIYAFKCKRADQLFNLVQAHIQICSNAGEDTVSRDFSDSLTSRALLPAESNYLDPTPHRSNGQINFHNYQNSTSTLPSSLPPPIPNLCAYENQDSEHNNNKSLPATSAQAVHVVNSSSDVGSYMNHPKTLSPHTSMPSYMNVNLHCDLNQDDNNMQNLNDDHAYMNLSPEKESFSSPKPRPINLPNLELQYSSYANLEAIEIEGLKKRFSTTSLTDKSPGPSQITPSSVDIKEVSYAVLDLNKKGGSCDNSIDEATGTPLFTSPSPTPDSPNKLPQLGYATIDFDKTTALSQSANLVVDNDEGSRKTRHNSTISELIGSSLKLNLLSE